MFPAINNAQLAGSAQSPWARQVWSQRLPHDFTPVGGFLLRMNLRRLVTAPTPFKNTGLDLLPESAVSSASHMPREDTLTPACRRGCQTNKFARHLLLWEKGESLDLSEISKQCSFECQSFFDSRFIIGVAYRR